MKNRKISGLKRADSEARQEPEQKADAPQTVAEPRKHEIEQFFFGEGGINRWRAQREAMRLVTF